MNIGEIRAMRPSPAELRQKRLTDIRENIFRLESIEECDDVLQWVREKKKKLQEGVRTDVF